MTPGELDREVDRLLSVRDARRKAASDAWEAHVVSCMERRIEQFEAGKLGLCSCRACLAAYVTKTVSNLCPEGHWQFYQEANRWTPWTA